MTDYMYRYLKENDNILLKGKIYSNMKIMVVYICFNNLYKV